MSAQNWYWWAAGAAAVVATAGGVGALLGRLWRPVWAAQGALVAAQQQRLDEQEQRIATLEHADRETTRACAVCRSAYEQQIGDLRAQVDALRGDVARLERANSALAAPGRAANGRFAAKAIGGRGPARAAGGQP